MEDVLREYVLPVLVRKKNNKFVLAIFEEGGNGSFAAEPLILLDGLPIFDTESIMNYNPLKVERLEIQKRKYYYDNILYDGILNFYTYDGNLPAFKLDPHTTVVDYEGLQKQRKFYAPKYQTKGQVASRIPDYRTLLNWSPNINTGIDGLGTLGFYTSDVKGLYQIVIQGMSKDGKTGSSSFYFNVKE